MILSRLTTLATALFFTTQMASAQEIASVGNTVPFQATIAKAGVPRILAKTRDYDSFFEQGHLYTSSTVALFNRNGGFGVYASGMYSITEMFSAGLTFGINLVNFTPGATDHVVYVHVGPKAEWHFGKLLSDKMPVIDPYLGASVLYQHGTGSEFTVIDDATFVYQLSLGLNIALGEVGGLLVEGGLGYTKLKLGIIFKL